MLEPLLRDFRTGTREGLLRASHRALMLAFAVLALPGLPLGGLYAALGQPEPMPWVHVGLLLVVGGVLAGVTLHLARLAATEAGQAPGRAALTAAIQAGTAPAIPFLIGCAFLLQPLALLVFWALAAGLYSAARAQLPAWVGPPRPQH